MKEIESHDLQRVVEKLIDSVDNELITPHILKENTMRNDASMKDVGSDIEGIKLQYIFKRIDQLCQCMSGKAQTRVNKEVHDITRTNIVLQHLTDYSSRLRAVEGDSLEEYFKPMMGNKPPADKVDYNMRHTYQNIVSQVREEMLYDMVETGKIPFAKNLREVLSDWNNSSKTWKAFFDIPSNLGTQAKKRVNAEIKAAGADFKRLRRKMEEAETIQDVVRENGMLIKDTLISGELALKDAPAMLEKFEQTDGGTTANLF